MSAIGTKRTWASALHMSAFDPKRTFGFLHLETAQTIVGSRLRLE